MTTTTTPATDELVEAHAELEQAAARVHTAEMFFIDRVPASTFRDLNSEPRGTFRMKRLSVATCREVEQSGDYARLSRGSGTVHVYGDGDVTVPTQTNR